MPSVVDKTFRILFAATWQTGELGCSPDEARQTLLDRMSTPGSWLHPGTDIVASVAPFYSLASQYRVSVDGEHKWYAQCGFEATAVSWVFPGRTVRMDAACLDCNEPLSLIMRR
jgi:hypothetical protein